MANNNDYNVLNEKVSSLINHYVELKELNRELENQVSKYESERKDTKTKIDTIITKIEELEGE